MEYKHRRNYGESEYKKSILILQFHFFFLFTTFFTFSVLLFIFLKGVFKSGTLVFRFYSESCLECWCDEVWRYWCLRSCCFVLCEPLRKLNSISLVNSMTVCCRLMFCRESNKSSAYHQSVVNMSVSQLPVWFHSRKTPWQSEDSIVANRFFF